MRDRRRETARRLRMSPPWLDAIQPEATPAEWRDTSQRGLLLRVEVSGHKTWVVRYRWKGKQRRYKLGSYPDLSLKTARAEVLGVLAQVSRGADPQADRERLRERARLGETVGAAVASWLDDPKQGPLARWKGGLDGGTARAFMPHFRRFERELGGRKLADLDASDCRRFVDRPETPATRNRALTALRMLFKWAIRQGLVEADPSAKLDKARETERTRVLTDGELCGLIHGFDATRYGRAVRMLAYTGLRRDEVLGARWAWLDVDAGVLTIPAEHEKAGRMRGEARRVALSSRALALLAEQRAALFAEGVPSPFVFATSSGERPHADALKPTLYKLRGRRGNGQEPSRDKRAKPRPAVLAPDDAGRHATIHDVRRTVAHALLNRLGAAPWVVDHVVLGHVRPKLMRTYMPTLPLDEARAALERWAELLDGILSGTARAAAR